MADPVLHARRPPSRRPALTSSGSACRSRFCCATASSASPTPSPGFVRTSSWRVRSVQTGRVLQQTAQPHGPRRYALTGREVTAILMQRHVKVDGKVRTDATYPAGFMDVVEIAKTGEQFRLIYDAKARAGVP